MARRPLTATMGSLQGLLRQHAFLSANMLSMVANIPQFRLAAALRGDYYLGSETETELLRLGRRCVEALEAILPLRIEAGDGMTLKLLCENGRSPDEVRSIVVMLLEPNHE